ncbi:MAG: hypothetical protein OHK0053_21600 [Microscillaceae bacterium]
MSKKNLAPIVLFAYKRPGHLRACLESLQKNPLSQSSDLFIYLDRLPASASEAEQAAARQVKEVVFQKKWAKSLHLQEAPQHLGLVANIEQGVTEVVEKYGKVIVLEDDLVLSPGFLDYMNEALERYAHEDQVMHINAYMYPLGKAKRYPPAFFLPLMLCWGWATWARAWQYYQKETEVLKSRLEAQNARLAFNLGSGKAGFWDYLCDCAEGKNQSWDSKWYASVFLKKGLCLTPYPSLVQNIGQDQSGTHSPQTQLYHIPHLNEKVSVYPEIQPCPPRVLRDMRQFFLYEGYGWRAIRHFLLRDLKNRMRPLVPSWVLQRYYAFKSQGILWPKPACKPGLSSK